MKTAQDWANEIEQLYESQKSGKTEPKIAREMNQTIKTLISLTKLKLQYIKDKRSSGDGVAVAMLEEASNPETKLETPENL